MAKVSVDLASGTATVAGREITVGEHPEGLRLHGPDGPVLRALSFGRRRFAVRAAEGCPDPADALARSVGFLAFGRDPQDAAVEALALFLAGAREDGGGPGLTEAALAVLRATGWTATDLDAAAATAVDDLARGLIPAAPEADDGWTRLQLAPATIEETRTELAADLLTRAAHRSPPFSRRRTKPPESHGMELGPAAVGEEHGRATPGSSTAGASMRSAEAAQTPGAGPGAPPSGSAADVPPAADPSTADGPGTRFDDPGDRAGSASGEAAVSVATAGTADEVVPGESDPAAVFGPVAEMPRFPVDPSAAGSARTPPGPWPRPLLPAADSLASGHAWHAARPPRQQGVIHRPFGTVRRSAPPLPAPGTWAPIPRPASAPEHAGTLITGPWAPLAEGAPSPAAPPEHHVGVDPVLRLVAEDEDLAERLARVLHDEADLRGMAP